MCSTGSRACRPGSGRTAGSDGSSRPLPHTCKQRNSTSEREVVWVMSCLSTGTVERRSSTACATSLDPRPATDPRWTGAGSLTHATQHNREGEPS